MTQSIGGETAVFHRGPQLFRWAVVLVMAMLGSLVPMIAGPVGSGTLGPRTAAAVDSLSECGPSEITVGLYGGSVSTGLVAGSGRVLDAQPDFCVVLIPTATWAGMSVADFREYDLLWIGNDSFYDLEQSAFGLEHDASHFAVAASTVTVWEQAIDPAKVIVAGGDFDFHYGANQANAVAVVEAMVRELAPAGSDGNGAGLVLQAGQYALDGHPWFQNIGGSFTGLHHGGLGFGNPSPSEVNADHPFNSENGFDSESYLFYTACHDGMRIDPGSPVESYNLQPLFWWNGGPCFMMSDPNFPPLVPEVGLTQDLTSVERGVDGSFDLTLSFLIENLGTAGLGDVGLSLDLEAAFVGALVGSVVADDGAGSCSSAVLDGSASVEAGGSCTAVLRVNVDGIAPNTTYLHSASVAGSSPLGTVVSDVSDDDETDDGVLDPSDANGNGVANDPGEDDPTPFIAQEQPAVGLTQDVVDVLGADDGSYELTYAFLVENLGDVELSNVELTTGFGLAFVGATVTSPVADDVAGDCSSATLDGSASVPAGGSCTAVLTVTVDGLVSTTTYEHSASVDAASPLGTVVSDVSDDDETDDGVLDPSDANGNGVANDPGEDDPTPFTPQEAPAVGLTQDLTSVDQTGVGVTEITYSFLVENLGDVVLSDVGLSADFGSTFAGLAVSGPVPDPAGDCSSEMAAGSGSLGVGGSCVAVWTVTVEGLSVDGSYLNSVSVQATSPGSAVVSDISDDDTTDNGVLDPSDSNGNGDAGDAGEDDPTPLTVSESPEIEVSQSVAGVERVGPGVYDVTYEHVISNSGDVDLVDIGLSSDYSTSFPGASVTGPVPDSAGDCSTEVANSSAALGVGESCTAVWTVTVDGFAVNTTYSNFAAASAVSPLNTTVSAVSVPVDVRVDENPAIGLTKDFTSITEISEGVSEVTFSYLIENLGDAELNRVKLEEDFRDTFFGKRVSGPVSDDDAGTCSTTAFVGSASLDAGESCVAVWVVTVTTVVPGVLFENNASVSANSPSGVVVEDVSDDDETDDGVLDPSDSNGNGRADDRGEDDPTPVLVRVLAPSMILNQVWDDLDQDGIQDDGEPGIVGIPVNLYGYYPATGVTELLVETFTGGGGNCPAGESPCVGVSVFRDVKPGPDRWYVIEIEVPAGNDLSPPKVGSDDEIDSDVSLTTRRSEPFVIEEDSRYRVIDMGFVPADSTPEPFWWLGDVNCDGQVNIVDALITAQYSVGLRTGVENCSAMTAAPATTALGYRGDMNNDGATNIVDALLVARCSVRIGLVGCDAPLIDCPTGICEYTGPTN